VSRVRDGAALPIDILCKCGKIEEDRGCDMLTIQQVADDFHVTRKTVYNWIQAGRIAVIRIGGVLRVEQSEVDRIKRGEVNSDAEQNY